MNLEWQINIVNALIAEKCDATIADYIELVNELILIENNGTENKIRSAAAGVPGA